MSPSRQLAPWVFLFAVSCVAESSHPPAPSAAPSVPLPPDPEPPRIELVDDGETHGWVVATYPVWGLPRDLADAPLTFLNRTGMNVVRALDSKSFGSGRILVLGSTVAFLAAGVVDGWAYANSHLYEQLFYSEAFGWGYAGIGFVCGVVTVAGYEYAVVPMQTALLRTGIDTEFWKGDATRCAPEADGTYSTDALLAHARSTTYFPNWQLLARNRKFVLAAERED